MLVVENLSIIYKNHQVLKNFDLTLAEGEFLALLGDSGSGKSSALRFIAGLDEVDSGQIVLDNLTISKNGQAIIKPEQRKIGMVFQDYALFPHMTVAKNIAFGLYKQSKTAQTQKVKTLLKLVNLSGIEKKYPHQLSGGEQQRVALARALAPEPKLLLLDEPFSSLDKNHRDVLVPQVRDILKQAKITVILVTHDKNEATAFADKIGEIKNQQLEIKQ